MSQPLQTANVWIETWVPPQSNSRFMRYDASDEHWMRPAGLGTVTRVRDSLYDVLDERGHLVGYTRSKPSGSHREIKVLFCDAKEAVDFVLNVPLTRWSQSTEVLIVRERQWGVCGTSFTTWQCRLEDGPKLILGKWIVCLGEDRLHEFANHIARRAYERKRMDGVLDAMNLTGCRGITKMGAY